MELNQELVQEMANGDPFSHPQFAKLATNIPSAKSFEEAKSAVSVKQGGKGKGKKEDSTAPLQSNTLASTETG